MELGENTVKRAGKVIGAVFFALAGLLAAYAIWAFVQCQGVVSEAVAMGQLTVKGSEYEVASFYMSSCGEYCVDALLLFAAGWLLLSLSAAKRARMSAAMPDAPESGGDKKDDELDEWFESMEQQDKP